MRNTSPVLAVLMLCAALPMLGSDAVAQQARNTPLVIPVTGMADFGGTFNGSFAIRDFRLDDDVVVATGTATGVLSDATGLTRTVIMPLALPLDTDASAARRNTDVGLAGERCRVMPVDFAAAAVNVRGTTIAFSPSALDIAVPAAAVQSPAAPALAPGTSMQVGVVPSFAGGAGDTRPGTVATGSAARAAADQANLVDVLCAASDVGDGDRARLVQALNQVLAAF
jgi:hypothetical protein